MKDNEIREIVDKLRDTAVEFHNHQSLRERLAYVLEPMINKVKEARGHQG